LVIAEALNVSLNLLFVLGFKMQNNGQDVLAVGLTTLISQAIQALLIVIFLHRSKNPYSHLEYKGIALYKKETQLLLKHGLMAGLQFFIFSISNLIIQRSVNGYSDSNVSRIVAMNGNAAALQLEGYIAMVLKTFGVACTIMTAQNFGAQNKKNLTKILWMTLLTSTTISIVMSGLAVLLYRPLVSLFLPQKAFASASDYSASLEVAHQRLLVIALFYFVDSWMDNMFGYCRGLGHPYVPSVVTFFATTVYRSTFIFAI
jgi:Na+-driven multidrug efflux pump